MRRTPPRITTASNTVFVTGVSAVGAVGGVTFVAPTPVGPADVFALNGIVSSVPLAASGAISAAPIGFVTSLLVDGLIAVSLQVTAPSVAAVAAAGAAGTTRAVRVPAPFATALGVPGQVLHIP